MKVLNVLLVAVQVLDVCFSFHAAPLVVASHRLVKGLKSELNPKEIVRQSTVEATNMLKRMVTECSSDTYLIVNVPGLTYGDLTENHKDNWPFLRKYMMMASTTIGVPRMGEPLDLDMLERYIINTCEAETIQVLQGNDGEVQHYIDIRKRVIKVEMEELPEDEAERAYTTAQIDELMRKILRKVPSPHYSIIVTSDKTSNVHFIPDEIVESFPKRFEIFDDIVNHPSRANEYERNDRFHQTPPDWIPEKNKLTEFLDKRSREAIHLFDPELWEKNEKLITTVAVMIISIGLSKTLQVLLSIKRKIASFISRRKAPVIAHHKID